MLYMPFVNVILPDLVCEFQWQQVSGVAVLPYIIWCIVKNKKFEPLIKDDTEGHVAAFYLWQDKIFSQFKSNL